MTIAKWQLRLFLLVPTVAMVATGGCAATPDATQALPDPVLDALLGSERITVSFDSLLERAALTPDSDFRATRIGRDAHHSHHVVAIRNAETPHRHDEHDLLVVILEGHGTMLIGEQTRAVGAGSILYIPRHTRHAFTNESAQPATAYAIYTPPFDGKDRVPVE